MFRSLFKKLDIKRIFLSKGKVPVNNQENTTGKSQSTSRPETRFYYACAGSRVGPAIFFSWQDCQKQVQVHDLQLGAPSGWSAVRVPHGAALRL